MTSKAESAPVPDEPARVAMAARQAVGIGAGGHAVVVVEMLSMTGGYEIVGLLDKNPALWHTQLDGVPVLGGDDLLPSLYARGVRCAFLGVGGVRDGRPRRDLFLRVAELGFEIITVIHPRAVVSGRARLGAGTTVMAGACVGPGARIGDNVIVNTGAIVEHHCELGNHVHIASGARLAGGVTVGECSHVGVGASVLQDVRIGRCAVVGAGAVVLENVADDLVVAGVPAIPITARQR